MSVFALDIGTRKVAGMLGELRGNKVKIIDAVIKEHEKRAMIDGQIHSIEDVTKIVKEVKEELEQKNSVKITKVTTALAGRSLHTEKISVKQRFKGEVSKSSLLAAELAGVRQALTRLAEKNKKDYYCVGYSVAQYTVDGAAIKNPLQQYAKESLGTEIIVTFLPKVVFDSVLKVLKNCGLCIEGITLEPIAALFVTIPEDMRLLNLALVDVGAGTSDIAITDKGKITAYGMIPKAGDEITEEVCGKYLVDFTAGEKIKKTAGTGADFEACDIFNRKLIIVPDEFENAISEKTQELAKEIADEILVLNEKQPQAVVMVGGGSGLAVLHKKIAQNLSLPESRVGSRVPENAGNIENLPEILKGTEGITPVGILETALFEKGLGFIEVMLNGEKEYIINLKQEVRVIDVIASVGMEMSRLYGRPGAAITYTFNGQMKILRGGMPEHSKIFINGDESSIDAPVKTGDKIFITESKPGKNAGAMIRDILPSDYFLTVEVNGKTERVEPFIAAGGKEVTADEPVSDRAQITAQKNDSIRAVLAKTGYNPDASGERDIIITLNSEPVVLKQRNYRLKLNSRDASPDFKVKNMDKIEYEAKPSFYKIRDVLRNIPETKITVNINGKKYEIESEKYTITMNGRNVSPDEFLINGADIKVNMSQEKPMLSSIFRVFPVETQAVKGKMMEIKQNGLKTGYTSPISDGDEIEIRFV